MERPIATPITKSFWLRTAALLSPGLLLAVLFAVHSTREATAKFAADNWGSIASAWGLGVSFYVLFVAKGAKKAAEEAREESRRRNLAEDLRGAQGKAQEVGQFIHDEQWHAVFLRSQEITGVCSLVLNRWSTELTTKSKVNITLARSQADSIARVAMNAHRTSPSGRQIVIVSAAQRRLHELLSEELGESLRVIERSSNLNV